MTLRDVLPEDLAVFYEYNRDPESVRMAAFTVKDPDDRAAFDAYWARNLANPEGRIRTILYEGQVAGSVLSYVMEGDTEVSYWLGRSFWGKGLASEALAAFVAETSTRPLWGRAAADNLGSIRVLEKCGFKFVKADRGFANARGEEIDEVVMRLD
ncbi:MAG: N-acetyltransferase [Anaerolineae bacterium]|nr:MAG: N-acetyltransferase [Anaerolineae bacterium]